jgi:hypothetical protein
MYKIYYKIHSMVELLHCSPAVDVFNSISTVLKYWDRGKGAEMMMGPTRKLETYS